MSNRCLENFDQCFQYPSTQHKIRLYTSYVTRTEWKYDLMLSNVSFPLLLAPSVNTFGPIVLTHFEIRMCLDYIFLLFTITT